MKYLACVDYTSSSRNVLKFLLKVLHDEDDVYLVCAECQLDFLDAIQDDVDDEVDVDVDEEALVKRKNKEAEESASQYIWGHSDKEVINRFNEHRHEQIAKGLSSYTEAIGRAHPAVKVSSYHLLTSDDVRSLLLEKSEEFNVDVVVVGSRSLSPLSGIMVGSVSDFLLRHCRVPVTVVRNVVEPS